MAPPISPRPVDEFDLAESVDTLGVDRGVAFGVKLGGARSGRWCANILLRLSSAGPGTGMFKFDPRSVPTPPGPFRRSANVMAFALVVLVVEELR